MAKKDVYIKDGEIVRGGEATDALLQKDAQQKQKDCLTQV